ncbi:unnamed protein product [Vicia faba]|uniref:F-box/LRR-repeat protein 15-like leucin rich repeat domain-containing protein n=1 Tax=Vicia faba TaxID=3906 RepID=A0AAV1BAT1_VICFA|nr:unnamed protein product [Vicia faba]
MRFQHLESLSLCGCTELNDSGLTRLLSYGSNLQKLNLDCCLKVTDYGLSLVASGCPSLTSISLYRCINISDDGLETLATACLSLKCINLSYCSQISDKGLKALTQRCRQLQAVNISHCESIRGVGFKGCSKSLTHVEAWSCKLNPEGVTGIISGGGIEYLDVSCLSWYPLGDTLLGIRLSSNLKVLNFRMCRSVSDTSIVAIAMGCTLLEEWNLALCHEVRISGWQAVGLYCQNLKRLHVNRCRNLNDNGLQALRDGCRSLSVLYLNGCVHVTPFALELFKSHRANVCIKDEEINTCNELSDFGYFIIMACGITVLQQIDISFIYHIIHGQATIKLYVIYNVLEVTCGGCQSAHTAAIAVLCAERGITSHLLLRGEQPEILTGYNLMSTIYGNVTYVPRTMYANREEMLKNYARSVAGNSGAFLWFNDIIQASSTGELSTSQNFTKMDASRSERNHLQKILVVNEGAGDSVALLGIIRLVQYLSQNHLLGKQRATKFVVDAGTGTTAIGIGLAAIFFGLPWEVHAVMLADKIDGYRKQEKHLIVEFSKHFNVEFLDHDVNKEDAGIVHWVERDRPRNYNIGTLIARFGLYQGYRFNFALLTFSSGLFAFFFIFWSFIDQFTVLVQGTRRNATSALDAECACIDTNLCICMFFLNLGDFLVQKLGEGVKGVYISIDVDCLDPAFAPGVSHIEPGGLSFRDVLNILHNLQGDVVAGDVVELNPQRDTVDGMTAMVAAKLVREMAAKIAK